MPSLLDPVLCMAWRLTIDYLGGMEVLETAPIVLINFVASVATCDNRQRERAYVLF